MSKKVTKIDEIDQYSEQLREVLAKIPNWFLRWGTILIIFILIIVFSFSWIIKYPDVVVSEITITTENQPLDIICKTNGEVQKIFVENNQKVKMNEILAYMVNKADFKDVISLSKLLEQYDTLITIENIKFPKDFQLGELQNTYNEFYQAYSNYWLQKNNKPIEKEITSLTLQKKRNKTLINQLQKKRTLFQEELQLRKKDIYRDSAIHSKGFISDREFEEKEILLIEKKREYQDVINQISNAKLAVNQIEQEIIILSNNNSSFSLNNKQTLLLNIEKLKGDISGWKEKYLFITPIDGRISFNQFIKKNKYLKEGQNIFTIIQKKEGKLIGQVNMPIIRSGKVKIGQQVNIKLNNYPFQEYGMLIGEIKNISLTPTNDIYDVTVILKNGLNTTYDKELIFKQKMKGSAEVITEELRLIERMFYQFRKIITK